MATSRHIHDLLNRLAAAEERFLQSDFLAPALRGGVVHVRIAGIVCRLKVEGSFEGWGAFRPTGPAAARLLRPATLAECRRYLELLPQRRLILCQPLGRRWLARPAHQGDRRFAETSLVPVRFVEEAERFETVEARYDGVQCWFEGLDGRADPAAAAYLRTALQAMEPPEQVRLPGLTAEQRAAYALAHALRLEAQRDRTEDRLRAALAHAGADFHSYAERDDVYRVEYVVDGARHVSVVRKGDLSVQLAGICLNGTDQRFDLHSLVGVLREADGDFVPRVGADNSGMAEELYWDVHPPRE
jgi:hypothetical protein